MSISNCDGCARGLYINSEGHHIDLNGRPVQSCTAEECEECPHCDGIGEVDGEGFLSDDCPICDGLGEVPC
jgi:hypothetical protein